MQRPSRGTVINGAITAAILLLVLALVLFQTGLLPVTAGDYEERQLTVTDCQGTTEATITVDVAQSFSQQYVGLSRTSELPADRGMLFPLSQEGDIRIEMRNMNYDLDVIYVGSDGKINSIQHGDAPNNILEYYLTYDSVSGQGQYVIEANSGWAQTNNVSTGDCVIGLSSS